MAVEMSKEKEKELFQVSISFSKIIKDAKEKESLFNRMLTLIKEHKESFPAKLLSYKRRKEIVLDSDEFMFSIRFGKHPSTVIFVRDPEENMEIANGICNSLINFLNIILEEPATNSRVFSSITMAPKKPFNLAKKIVGTTQLAKINEITKETLNPIAIALEYRKEEREYLIYNVFGHKTSQNLVASFTIYKGALPFNLLPKEYEELKNPKKILKMIAEMEV